MGAVKPRPFRLNKSCSGRSCKYKIKQSIDGVVWQVNLWLKRPKGGTWEEATVLLYAEMAGTAKDVGNLNELFDNFLLNLEE